MRENVGERSDILSTAQVVEDRVMGLPRFRLTVRRLMVGVAFACLSLALFRLHPVLGIFAFSMTCMALVRTYEIIDRTLSEGRAIPPSRLALTFLASATVVSVILVGSFLPAMCAYELTFESIPTGCSFPTHTRRNPSRTWPAHPRRRLGGVPMCLHAQEESLVRTG